MTAALLSMSHSPLLDHVDPGPEVTAAVTGAFDQARSFVRDFDPDLIVNFGPDHYNGFFYELMPTVCIGYDAVSIGDYGSQAGPLNVPTETARELAGFVLDQGLDTAVSLRMEVDHGAVQPLELMFGDIAAKPVIPIFLNCVAPPFSPVQRIRLLGRARTCRPTNDSSCTRRNSPHGDSRAVRLPARGRATPHRGLDTQQRVPARMEVKDLAPEWDRRGAAAWTLMFGDIAA